ncbi:MAG TPA: ribosomal-processing cysteine protease Prp [Syntrophomonadaceae bacterium]|nr:ribosomal-processing cysteine protease Prp [Syntrophomonadaceae bacterium]
MLKITINYKDENIIGFTVKGHAAYAPKGEDIYCAGISAITQTALIGLIKHLNSQPEYIHEPGNMSVVLSDNISQDDKEKAQLILTTMLAGLESMEESYGKYMKLEIRRC